ncbi:MAG: amidase [Deltaproteobacteria bacterium]|nr:amidase [Deltaproteobacteria bacterium]
MQNLTYRSATQLLADIREKRISCSDLLEAFIENIDQKNPRINAVVATDYAVARRRAKAADEALKKGENWGPLHGLPITIKDTFEVAGMPCTAGIPLLKEHMPGQNADVVQSLLDAGVVIVGKTNVPTGGMDFQSYNDVYGQTNNPWDVALTPGGSSGGAAAALAAGMTALEMGSDIGGSIRIPAHFCGVFGHKSTFNIVPRHGHIPPSPGLFPADYMSEGDIVAAGPLARSARDLALAMRLIVKPGPAQRSAWRIELPPPIKKNLKDCRIGLWLDDPLCPVDAAVGGVLQDLADKLARAGVEVVDKQPDIDFARSHEVYVALFAAVGGVDMPDDMYDRLVVEGGETDLQEIGPRARFVRGTTQSHRGWLRMDTERQGLRQKWAQYFEQVDVLLCPAAPVTAFAHDHRKFYDRTLPVNDQDRSYVNTLYTWSGLAGVAHLPATAVPAGITSKGLPVGAQIVGPYLGDRTTIQVAVHIEDEVGGFVPPPELS